MACSTAPGVDATIADAALDELMTWVRKNKPELLISTFERPFWPVAHTEKTKAIADEYVECVGRQHAAQILNVQPAQVQVFSAPTVVVYVKFNSPSSQSAGKTTSGKVVTILSLGKLDHDKGLPGIGSPPQYHKLNSGEVLYTSGDAVQTFNPTPKDNTEPGIAILTLWTR